MRFGLDNYLKKFDPIQIYAVYFVSVFGHPKCNMLFFFLLILVLYIHGKIIGSMQNITQTY